MQRPVDPYALGIHHLAQPTLDPEATLGFYVDTMGGRITHCVSSKAWRPTHYDFIHLFIDLGKDTRIAMFYYFGAKSPEEWPKYGTHLSLAAASIDELDRWEAYLSAGGHQIVWRAQYEVMSSIYVWDPNGRFVEIAADHRPLTDVDAEDGQLTAQALCRAAAEKADSIEVLWRHKAALVEERHGALPAPSLLVPDVEEFHPLIGACAGDVETDERGIFTVVRANNGELRVGRPDGMPEAVWNGVGTGGIKGTIAAFDERELVIAP